MLIPKDLFSALLPLTDRESKRYALAGIKLERLADGSPVAIATDGRKMLAYTWIEPIEHVLKPTAEVLNGAFDVILSAEALAQVKSWKFDRAALRFAPEIHGARA